MNHCSLSTDFFPGGVIECRRSLMLEERQSVFLSCRCQRLLRAAYRTNGASFGPLFPSDGHSRGRSATQRWGSPLLFLHTQLLSRSPSASQSCWATAGPEPSLCCTGLSSNRRGGERGSSRRGWTTVMSQPRICLQRRADASPCLFSTLLVPPQRQTDRRT